MPFTATERAGLLSHADLTSATKGWEGSGTTVASPHGIGHTEGPFGNVQEHRRKSCSVFCRIPQL